LGLSVFKSQSQFPFRYQALAVARENLCVLVLFTVSEFSLLFEQCLRPIVPEIFSRVGWHGVHFIVPIYTRNPDKPSGREDFSTKARQGQAHDAPKALRQNNNRQARKKNQDPTATHPQLRSLVKYPKHQCPTKSGCSNNPEGIEQE